MAVDHNNKAAVLVTTGTDPQAPPQLQHAPTPGRTRRRQRPMRRSETGFVRGDCVMQHHLLLYLPPSALSAFGVDGGRRDAECG